MLLKSRGIIQLCSIFMLILSLLLLATGLLDASNILYLPLSITLLLTSNIVLSLYDLQKNILYIVFQLTFFLFLVSGALFDGFDGINYFNSFSHDIATKTLICYWLAAFTMWFQSFFGIYNIHLKMISKTVQKKYDIPKIRLFSLVAYYVTVVAFILVTFDKILFRQSFSLQDYYANYQTSLPGIVVKISDCYLITFTLFLATKPAKREIKLPVIIFFIISALTLLYGVRNVIILNLLFIVVYAVFRNGEESWITRRMVFAGMISLPIVIILLQAFDVFRRNIGLGFSQIKELLSFDLLKDFFVSQSVSSNILANGITYQNILGGQPVPYTFGTLYTYLTQNMIVRIFTGASAYSSNSVEGALSSGNLGARLAYHLYPTTYLKGTGMGGSYVADLFVDFSFIGVIIGTIAVCYFLNVLAQSMKNSSPFMLALILVAIRWIIYMPRDSYFAWAMQAFSFMNLLLVFIIYLLCRIDIPALMRKK